MDRETLDQQPNHSQVDGSLPNEWTGAQEAVKPRGSVGVAQVRPHRETRIRAASHTQDQASFPLQGSFDSQATVARLFLFFFSLCTFF